MKGGGEWKARVVEGRGLYRVECSIARIGKRRTDRLRVADSGGGEGHQEEARGTGGSTGHTRKHRKQEDARRTGGSTGNRRKHGGQEEARRTIGSTGNRRRAHGKQEEAQ